MKIAPTAPVSTTAIHPRETCRPPAESINSSAPRAAITTPDASETGLTLLCGARRSLRRAQRRCVGVEWPGAVARGLDVRAVAVDDAELAHVDVGVEDQARRRRRPGANGMVHVDAVVHVTGDLTLAGSDVRRRHHANPLWHEDVRLAGAERGREVDDAVLLPVQVGVGPRPAGRRPAGSRRRESTRARPGCMSAPRCRPGSRGLPQPRLRRRSPARRRVGSATGRRRETPRARAARRSR